MGQFLCSFSCLFGRDQNFPKVQIARLPVFDSVTSDGEDVKPHKCNCVRVGPVVDLESSTHSSMPGLVYPSVSEDSSTEEEVEGETWARVS